MGKRGPPPTPTAILKLRGSWRAGLNPDEPRPPRGKPRMPGHFTGELRSLWRRLTGQLDECGLLTQIDWAQLERWCVYFLRWRQCEQFLAANGTTYPVKNDDPSNYIGRIDDKSKTAVVGFKEYPQVRESHRLDRALKQIEDRFGLTPSARARLRAAPAEAAEPAAGKSRFFRASS